MAADADLDAAVEGVAASAFGFNGQKCSACSRAIVDASLYDVFCDRLQERVAEIKVGDPAENFYAGPVISERSYRKVLDYIAIGKAEGRLLQGGHAIETAEGGYYIAPTVIADVAPDCADRAGGDIWAGAGGHQGAWASMRLWRSPTIRSMG